MMDMWNPLFFQNAIKRVGIAQLNPAPPKDEGAHTGEQHVLMHVSGEYSAFSG